MASAARQSSAFTGGALVLLIIVESAFPMPGAPKAPKALACQGSFGIDSDRQKHSLFASGEFYGHFLGLCRHRELSIRWELPDVPHETAVHQRR